MPSKLLEKCNHPACEKPAYKRGICEEHAAENYVLACTVVDDDGTNCDGELWAKGRCRAHYMRLHRKKNGEKAPPLNRPRRRYKAGLTIIHTRIPATHAALVKAEAGRLGLHVKSGQILSTWANRHQSDEENENQFMPDHVRRQHGLKMVWICCRITDDEAEVITRASGRKDGLYAKAASILSNWAERQQRAQAA